MFRRLSPRPIGGVFGEGSLAGAGYSFCPQPPSTFRNLAGTLLAGSTPALGRRPRQKQLPAVNSERWLPRPHPRGRQDSGADPRPRSDPYLLAPGRVQRLLSSARNLSPGPTPGSRGLWPQGSFKELDPFRLKTPSPSCFLASFPRLILYLRPEKLALKFKDADKCVYTCVSV